MDNTARITVNGEEQTLTKTEQPLTGFLKDLGFEDKPVLVEWNGTALHQREHAETVLRNGDRLEIIQIVAGG
ncbi:MAG: sulfur carrier protein ThiS [Verrucomicrobiota bacterium]